MTASSNSGIWIPTRTVWVAVWTWALISTTVGSTCASSQASAQESPPIPWLTDAENEFLTEHPVIKIAPTPDFPPLEYWTPEGEMQGVVSSYLEHFEDVLNIRFERIRTKSWEENLAKLESRDIDAVSLIVPWIDRDYVTVSKAYVSYPATIIVRQETQGDVSLKDLAGKRVAVPNEYTGEAFLRRNHPEIVVVEARDPSDGVRMLATGEVDAFLGGAGVAAFVAQREGIANLRIAGETDFLYRNGMGVRSDWGIFAGIITKTLDRLTPAQRESFHTPWINTGFLTKRFYEYPRFWWGSGVVLFTMALGTAVMIVWNRKQAAFIDQLETEKKRTELARQEAVDANRAKSAFVATISHEIRTPMNGVLGMCELLQQTELGRQQQEYLGYAQSSAKNLVGLINDILDFSKMEAGKLDLESIPFSLQELLDDVVHLLRPQCESKNLTLQSQVGDDVGDVYVGDPLRIRQLLINLIGNAIKFTEHGKIDVVLSRCRFVDGLQEIAMEVQDTGIGIAQDKLDAIFNPFEQEQVDTARNYGGTGLGLAIVRILADKMGGRVWVESDLGKGSTFGFSVLLESASDEQFEAWKSAQQRDQVSGDASDPRRVLVAEDGKVNQEVAAGLLRRRGHLVDVVDDGQSALQALKSKEYDVVLMDIEMPRLGGMEAIRKIRSNESAFERVPVIAITGHAMTGDRERFLNAGFDGHLVKPFRPNQLYKSVESIPRANGSEPANAAASPDLPHKEKRIFGTGQRNAKGPSSESQVFNAVILDPDVALARTGGDQQLADLLLKTCIDEVPAIIERAKASVASQDYDQARACGHSLRSSFSNVGAIKAALAAEMLEFCQQKNGQCFHDALEQIELAFQKLVERLER